MLEVASTSKMRANGGVVTMQLITPAAGESSQLSVLGRS